jgi:YggT family protein
MGVLLIGIAYKILVLALFARMIASWFGAFRYSRWMRPAYILTDWIVEPLRRVVPSMGPFDITILVAWLALMLIHRILLAVLVG